MVALKEVFFVLYFFFFQCCSNAQPCPENPGMVHCSIDTAVSDNSWISEISVRRIPNTLTSARSVSWRPDQSISQGEGAYRVVVRKREERASFVFSDNITASFGMFVLDNLEFDARYEALVCYGNVTRELLRNDSGFIPECGYCRTCFGTGIEVFLNITSTTVADVLVSSQVESQLYECRATGSPLPLQIMWRMSSGSRLTNNMDGVIITTYVNNGEIISILRMYRDLQDVTCSVSSTSSSNSISRGYFQPVDPVIAFIEIVESTVKERTFGTVYQCQAVGEPSPLMIGWRAVESQGRAVELTDDIVNVEILNSVDGEIFISELSLLNDDYTSIACVVASGNYSVTEESFQATIKSTSTSKNLAWEFDKKSFFSPTAR